MWIFIHSNTFSIILQLQIQKVISRLPKDNRKFLHIQFNQFRYGIVDSLDKRVKRTGFQNKTGNVITCRDPDSRFSIP